MKHKAIRERGHGIHVTHTASPQLTFANSSTTHGHSPSATSLQTGSQLHLGENFCNHFRTLIPNSLSNLLQTRHGNTTYAHHINSLTEALQHRRKPLSKALETIRGWFIMNPLNLDHLEPYPLDNPWFIPMSDLSNPFNSPTKLTYPKKKLHSKPRNIRPLLNTLLSQKKTIIQVPPLKLHTPQLP